MTEKDPAANVSVLTQEAAEVQSEQPHRSLLGGALSVEYGVCSVAAAELARAVQNRLPQDVKVPEGKGYLPQGLEWATVVSDVNFPTKQCVAKVPIEFVKHEQHYPYKETRGSIRTPFSLMRQYHEHTEVISESRETVPKIGLRRNKVTFVVRQVRTTYRPGTRMLTYHIAGGAVQLPIATFEPRTDGECSYVQLGSEIHDDTVFVTQGDERQTERLALIEDLRKLVSTKDAKREYTDRVKEFVHSEIDRSEERIAVALGGYLAGMYKEYFQGYQPDPRGITLIGSKGDRNFIPEKHDAAQVGYLRLKDKSTEDGIEPEFALVRPSAESDRVLLCAISRGNVGIPIITALIDSGEAMLHTTSEMTSAEKYKAMMALTYMLFQDHDRSNPQQQRDDHDGTSDARVEFREALDLAADMTPYEYIAQTFDVRQTIKEQLQPICEKQEKLAQILGRRTLGASFEGTVPDVDLVTTRGSVSGHVQVESVEGGYQAKIIAKPDALVGVEPSQIASFTYDPTGPLRNTLPTGRDAEEFAILLSGFNKIKN